jgi:4-hydroxybenzoate polyprenyltransferase
MSSESVAMGTRVRQFFGLSRMTHSILDIAHPALGALLALGAVPSLRTVVIGFLAAFSGFTAVFALNDVMDCRVDCEKMTALGKGKECFDLDSVGQRHPLAQGAMPFRAALGWVIAWGALALGLAFLLGPLCALFMAAAAALEVCYCLLLRITHWKAALSGTMVTVGGLAGVFAVTSAPTVSVIAVFCLWAFAWEVGCRNIPNDWSDLEEDEKLGIRTIPVRFGRLRAARLSCVLMGVVFLSALAFPLAAGVRHPLIFAAGAAVAGTFLLVVPALQWLRAQTMKTSLAFFNNACFYPLAVFGVLGLVTIL